METMEKPVTPKVKVLKEEPCEILFSVELPKEDVAKETESVYQSIQARAALPGFRVGKAPLDLVRKNFSERARQTVMENLVSRAAKQVLRDRQMQIIDTPRVDKIDFDWDKPLLFQMKVEKDPEVKAKDYKGIKVNRREVRITDEMVNKTLEELRDRNASLVASPSLQVEPTHFAVIDFEGTINGKTFRGGSAKNYLMDMSAPQTIAGFSDGLVGARLNEPRSVKVRFPADYPQKEWANQEAEFKVVVKEIKEKKMPVLDDEFAKDLGLASLEELRRQIRTNLEKEETARNDKAVEDQIDQALLESNRFNVPPTLVEERLHTLVQRTRHSLERQGLLQPKDPQAEATLGERLRPQAEKDVRLSYLLKAIAKQEHLEAADTDVQELKKKSLADPSVKPEDVETYFKDHDLSIRAGLTEGKVMDFLKQNAKIKITDE